jgi:GNAT superfamily N-acetyltransferase
MNNRNTIPTEVTTWSLEMLDPAELRPARKPDREIQVVRAEVPSPELSRYLYASVGGDWYWYDRLDWSYERWKEAIEQPGHETWLLLDRGTPAGHFVLFGDGAGTVEIVYFGLLPAFIGQGLGGYLLTEAILQGWNLGSRWDAFPTTRRVWVHTCSLDGQPAALNNYQARGLRLFKTETAIELLPAEKSGPWPGAR